MFWKFASSYLLLDKTCVNAEIINSVAFHVTLGALNYTINKDGTIKLADQDLLRVLHRL